MANRPRMTRPDEFPPEELSDRILGLRRRAIDAGLTVSTEWHQEQRALRIQFAGDNGLMEPLPRGQPHRSKTYLSKTTSNSVGMLPYTTLSRV